MKLLNIISIIITALLLPSLALGSQSEFKIAANDGATNDNYDVEFTISSTIAIIGADSNSNNGALGGSAYLHGFDQPMNALCTNSTNLTCGDSVSGAVYYEITGGPLSPPQSTFTIPPTQSQIQIKSIRTGVNYSWRIRAVCNLSGTSKSPNSLTQLFTTLTSCDPPSTLFTDPITSNEARLNWSKVIGASAYSIFGNALV